MLKKFIKPSTFVQFRFYTLMQKKLQSLQPAIISPKTKHKSTIIWLHGLGDSSDGFEMLMRQIIPSHTKCVIPNAPIRPITLNAGYPMRAWYDIASLNKREEEDVKSMLESKEILTALVDQEVKHVPSEKIILGGMWRDVYVELCRFFNGCSHVHVGWVIFCYDACC